MFYKKERKQAAALSSLMSQTRDTMVCLEFNRPIDPAESQTVIDQKLRDCHIVDASNAFARYFGFKSRTDVLGKKMMDLFDGDVPDWFVNYGQEVEDQSFENLERVIQVPVKSELRTMRIQMQNIFECDKLVRQWITIRDISAEETAKLAAEESERFKLLAFESVGLQTFRFSFDPNDAVNTHGDMSVGDKGVPDWWEMVHSEDRPQLEESFIEFYAGKSEKLHGLFRSRNEEDKEVWYETWAVATGRNERNEPKEIVGVVYDRTETKAIEASMIASQRLESLGVLAGGIAHDFNNLLLTMLGAVDIAKRRHPDIEPFMKPVDDAASQLTSLCDQLLTYAGRGMNSLEAMNVTTEIGNFRDLLTLSVDKNVELNFSLDEDCWIQGDPSQIRQIIMNLVKNASDAIGGESGAIDVTLGKKPFDSEWAHSYEYGESLKPGSHIEITVTDSGGGIKQADIKQLFDPFFTTKFTGRGLGLAVVLGAVRGHGGAISVHSEPGKGTTMSIALPELDRQPVTETTNKTDSEAWSPGNFSILVVDDEETVRTTAGLLLQELGFEVSLVESGAQAVDKFDTEQPEHQIVLMDVTMPGVDGIAAASQILEKHPATIVILSSGYSNLTVPGTLSDSVIFLRKPYRLGELEECLKDILEHRLND